jgi:hypothetical protein
VFQALDHQGTMVAAINADAQNVYATLSTRAAAA